MISGRAGGQVAVQLFQPLHALGHTLFQAPDIRLSACDIRAEAGLPAAQLQILFGQPLCVGGHGSQLLLKLFQFRLFLGQLGFNLLNSGFCLLNLGGDTAVAILLPLQLLLNPGQVGVVVFHIAPEDSHLTFQLLVGGGEHIHLHPDGFQLSVPGAEGFPQVLCLPVEAVQIIVSLLQNEGSAGVVLFRLFCGGGQLFQGVQPHSHLHPLQGVLQLQILSGLFRLLPQRFQLQLQLGDLVPDAQQIVLGVLQLPLRLLLAVAVFGNTCRLLKDLPAVAAFQGENLVDSALTDIGIALPSQTGIHEHLMDIPKPGGLLVDIVFTVPGAVKPPGDHHLIGIVRQSPVGIVQRQGGLREAHSAALLGAAKDHILHFRAPEGLGALLAHDPENGIGDVGLAGAVGAHDGGDIIAEADQGSVRKGLEALQFQRFQIHSQTSKNVIGISLLY